MNANIKYMYKLLKSGRQILYLICHGQKQQTKNNNDFYLRPKSKTSTRKFPVSQNKKG